MNTENTNGRKSRAIEIIYPEGEFTVDQVYELNNRKLSKVAIQNKIHQLLLPNKISLAGTVRVNKVGRPRQKYVYNKL